MKFATLALIICGALSFPVVGGCDRELSHSETTAEKSNGTVTHKETTVKEKPDGTIVKETDKSVNKPAPNNP